MENKKILNGQRCDDYIDVPKDYSNPILEKYVMVEKATIVDDDPENFIIDLVPKKIEEINIDKQVHEAAKGTDLKSLILQVMRTGDESILNVREGSYGDASMFDNQAVNPMETLNSMANGVDLGSVSGMTPEDLEKYIQALINKELEKKGSEPVPTPSQEEKESEVK